MMDVFDLTDEEMDQRVGEVRESLLRTLVCRGQDDLVAMTGLADLLALLVAIKTMDNVSARPVILEHFITGLRGSVERHGAMKLDGLTTLH